MAKKKVDPFFRSELRDLSDATGDIYNPARVAEAQAEWNIIAAEKEKRYPYLTHVKLLSNVWPHLRLLADFMEVTTTPLRWPCLRPNFRDGRPLQAVVDARAERASRTNVTRIDFRKSGYMAEVSCDTPEKLIAALDEDYPEQEDSFRLFVVEDLSRDVIEALGSKLDIEPDFFREHIVDYAWCNIRDRWQEPPKLEVDMRTQRWIQLRYVTARYFHSESSFVEAVKQAENFNVLRRPDHDLNNKAVWDDKAALVGITRARASFWQRKATEKGGAIGMSIPCVRVILLDPTIQEGQPLWYGYRNWEATPGVKTRSSEYPAGPPRDSLFNDFIYWARKAKQTSAQSSTARGMNAQIALQILQRLICPEWLLITQYIRARLGQIEWEVTIPKAAFISEGVLKKLNVSGRLISLYREMLADSIQILSQQLPENTCSCKCAPERRAGDPETLAILAFQNEFQRVLSSLELYQQRINGWVTAMINIQDARDGRQDNKNVARLTWLATFFIPLSFMASLFSMQSDISSLKETYKVYFGIALPFVFVSLGIAWLLSHPTRFWSYGMTHVPAMALRQVAQILEKCVGVVI